MKAAYLQGLAVLTAVVGSALLAPSDLMRHIERRTEDYRLRWDANRRPPATNVVVIALDNESLQRLEPEYGRWPWPRDALAGIIRHCAAARLVVLDILMPEHDRVRPEGDAALAGASRAHGRVISAALLSADAPPPAAPAAGLAVDPGVFFAVSKPGLLTPYAALREACLDIGLVNILLDDDGVLRAMPVFGFAGAHPFETLPLAAARHAGAEPAVDVEARALRVGARRFPLDEYGRFLLAPRRAPPPVIPFAEVLEAARAPEGATPWPPEFFRGKTVFVGSTATGLQDDRYMTSLGELQPGVRVLADAYGQLLDGPVLRRAPFWTALILMLLLAALRLLRQSDRPRSLLLFTVFSTAGLLLLAAGGLRWMGVLIPLAPPLLMVFLLALLDAARAWALEWRRRRDLEALEAVKQQLTDMLVHDLRNQVGPVMMALSLLEEEAAQRNDAHGLLWSRTAHGSTVRLVSQIDSLLDIRRMEEGRMTLRRAAHALPALVQDAIAQFQPAAERADTRLVFTAPAEAEAWRVDVDATLMGRVLGNLVWNAIKYGRGGEPIEFGLLKPDNHHCVLTIGNRGDPIAPEDQQTLFQPFRVLARQSAFARFKGSGLGLAFCRMAVEAHGGSIALESPWPVHGDGVLIRITLPAAGSTAPAPSG